FRIGLQQAQGDARVAVVEATADELAIDVEGIHDLAGPQARGRLLHDLLEDPGVAGTPGVLQLDGGVGIHWVIVRGPRPVRVARAGLPSSTGTGTRPAGGGPAVDQLRLRPGACGWNWKCRVPRLVAHHGPGWLIGLQNSSVVPAPMVCWVTGLWGGCSHSP